MSGSLFAANSAEPPRYARCPLPLPQVRRLIAQSQHDLQSALNLKRRIQVAVAIPTFRSSIKALLNLVAASTCTNARVDVRVFIQIDNPTPPPHIIQGLQQLQRTMLDKLRVRINDTNLGAAAARNKLLDEAGSCGADYVIFFDDDILPGPNCVDEYVNAFLQHPHEVAFAGPTVLPPRPELLPTAILLSDVGFFWNAPERLQPYVPWAVTANVAVKYTDRRFGSGFPKTGGGEDVDFCVQLGHRVRAVPGATAVHPWWPQRRPKVTSIPYKTLRVYPS